MQFMTKVYKGTKILERVIGFQKQKMLATMHFSEITTLSFNLEKIPSIPSRIIVA